MSYATPLDPNNPDDLGAPGADSGSQPPDNSLYDIDHQATDAAIAAGFDDNSDTGKNSLAAAQNVDSSVAGQPNPSDAAAAGGYTLSTASSPVSVPTQPAGDFQGPITRLGEPPTSPITQTTMYPGRADTVVSTTPGISATLPGGGGGGTGQLSEAEWDKDFKDKFGYFDPTFDSRDAFLHEAQMGDTAIRGATGGGDQLAYMAGKDSDAGRIFGAIQGVGDKNFYGSQLGADWAATHDQSLADQAAALGQGGGQQAGAGAINGGLLVSGVKQAVATGNQRQLDWLKSQVVDVPANPVRNQDAFPVAAEIVKDLQTLGVDPKTIKMDNAGTIHFTSASGIPNSFPGNVPLADWVNDLAVLKNAIANQQAAPPAAAAGGGGGGYRAPARSGYTPRTSGYGGGGGAGGGAGAPGTFPAGNQMIDQSGDGGGVLLPGNNVKQGYYPSVQDLQSAKGGFVNPSGATVYYDQAGNPYGYYYGSQAATGGIQGDRRGLPY